MKLAKAFEAAWARPTLSFWQPLALGLLLSVALSQVISSASPRLDSGFIPGQIPDSHVENRGLCLIIRTYWAHGPRGGHANPPLLKMLTSLVNNAHPRWAALLLIMDSQPFYELPDILKNIGDQRIRIYDEKVGDQYVAKQPDGTWNAAYHDQLYSLTDEAIRACAPDTQWVIITNGDNEYDEKFIPRLMEVPSDADIVALHFYSRYQQATASADAHPCKENLLRFCHTDLAATIYRWPRFIAEGRAFSAMESYGIGLNDGSLAESLMLAGWKVHHISGVCLLSHSPSPQLCALHGGVWDDSQYGSAQHTGGRCLDVLTAVQLLQDNADLEVLQLDVSHDGSTFGFQTGVPVQLTCIRQRFEGKWQSHMSSFPEECNASLDTKMRPS